jgi:PAS domain S-box-containing protein
MAQDGVAPSVSELPVVEPINLSILSEDEQRFRAVFENAGVGMLEIDSEWRILSANAVYCQITGFSEGELIGQSCLAFTHPDDIEASNRALNAASSERISFEKRYRRKDGRIRWIRSNLARVSGAGKSARFLKIVEDIDAQKRAEQMRAVQSQILQLAIEDAPLEQILESLVLEVERLSPDPVLGSILLLDPDGVHLRHGAAPNLPRSYTSAIDGFAVGPAAGSCGTAVHRREPVHVSDIATDPLWSDFRDLALTHGLRACWSTPILSGHGRVLGTFAIYYREPRQAAASDAELIEFVSRTAALLIERKRSEQALRESEERFRNLISASNPVLYRHNADWSEMRQLVGGGFLADTVAPDPDWFDKYIDPEDQPHVWSAIQESIRTKSMFELEHRVIREDGTLGWTWSRSIPVLDDEGDIVEWFGAASDTTARNEAELALREERQTLEILHRIGSALAGELDLDRVVQMVTDAGVELTGAQFGAFFYNVVDAAGESYMLYTLSGADRSEFEKFGMPRNTQVFGPTFRGESVVRSDDITKDPRYGHNPPHHGQPEGHLPVVSYLALPVKGRSGEVIGGLFFGHPQPGRFKERHEHLMEAVAGQAAIAMDNARLFREAQREIEQRIRAEEALKALNETLESRVIEEIERRSNAEEALRQAQKMETIGQLSGGIAHDFNNLLQIIHGNLTILQRSLPAEQTKWQRSVANALTGTDRAAALTQRLLAFSRRQPLDPRPLDVNEMIGEMIELLHRTLGETIEIGTRLAADIPNALVDSNQLENAVLNLAINARDAMPGGGRLEIETGLADIKPNGSPAERDVQPGRYVRIAVRDTGTGMSPDVLSRAVEPFFSTKEVGQGTGLGLSMVYGFAKQSGGHLRLSSTEGEGTTAELFVPCASGAADARSARVAESALPQGHGERVLVCEDDSDVRRFSSDALTELGYEVVEAPNAQSALQAIEQGKIDLLFTDLVLPGGITGAELAEQARRLQPGLKLLFTTGYARTALDEERQASADGEVLAKPFSIDDLAARLRKLLD